MTVVFLVNYRNAPSVGEQPEVMLASWYVAQTSDGDHLLAGRLMNGLTWRVTSPLASFDAALRTIITSSGRRYQLVGPPAEDPTELGIIRVQLAMSGAADATDATATYWAAIGRLH